MFEILEHLPYEQLKTEDPLHGGDDTWVKVFRIIPENMIFSKVSIKMLNSADNISFSDLVSVYVKVFNQ